MADQFLHGVEVLEIASGPRPIRTVRSSVIGLIGTAPGADPVKFPLNTPVLIAGNQAEAAGLGATGTLPGAIADIFKQAGAVVVVVRVAGSAVASGGGYDDSNTLNNIIGGIDNASGNYEGVHAFLGAESVLGVVPRILIAPGYSENKAVADEMIAIASRLRAVVVADGPGTNDAAAIAYQAEFGSSRIFIVDPDVKVLRGGVETIVPASPFAAGIIAKVDNDVGFWRSPSNQEILGIIGTSRPIDFVLGDPNSRANLLNESNVATIIRQNGFRLWGNRTPSTDPQFAFLCVRRTADIIQDSILRAHLWAVDQGITKTYLEDVAESVNAYLRTLVNIGAILGGKCWPDPDLNTPANIVQGKVYFNFDFGPTYPAEHVTFRSMIENGYIEDLI